MREGDLVLVELRWLREREESLCASIGWHSAHVRWEGGRAGEGMWKEGREEGCGRDDVKEEGEREVEGEGRVVFCGHHAIVVELTDQ